MGLSRLSEGRAGVASEGGRGGEGRAPVSRESVVQCLRRGASCSHVPRQGGHAKGLEVWQDLASRQPLRRARAGGGGGELTDLGGLVVRPIGPLRPGLAPGAAVQKAGGGGVPSSGRTRDSAAGHSPLSSLHAGCGKPPLAPSGSTSPSPGSPSTLGSPSSPTGASPVPRPPRSQVRSRERAAPQPAAPPNRRARPRPGSSTPSVLLCEQLRLPSDLLRSPSGPPAGACVSVPQARPRPYMLPAC